MFHYYLDNQGMECAKFIGKNGRSINVGYVVDKDANLFWTYERWFFHFDPETETAREPDPSLAKWNWVADKSMYSVSSNKITYGDSYFFDEFIKQISYDSIKRADRDFVYELLSIFKIAASPTLSLIFLVLRKSFKNSSSFALFPERYKIGFSLSILPIIAPSIRLLTY